MPIALPKRFSAWRDVIGRVRGKYRRLHGRAPRLLRPDRYTEKVQWRKLFDLDPRYAILSDKLAVRDLIVARTGGDTLVPLLWHGDDPDRIPFDALTPPYVLKGTHACGQTIFVGTDAVPDREAIRATARGWLAHCHGSAYDEPSYIAVPRRLVVERRIVGPDGDRPIERKIFVFNGRPAVIQSTVIEGEAVRHGAFHTPEWEWRSWHFTRAQPESLFAERPPRLADMLDTAARLGAGFEHVRVDFYDCGDRFYVGEITVYPWSGMAVFNPDEADYAMGSLWRLRHPAPRAVFTVLTRPWRVRPAG